jgi:transcription initiation factor TFIIIB Brf1 subunit/transcription initiation factor TFIIB
MKELKDPRTPSPPSHPSKASDPIEASSKDPSKASDPIEAKDPSKASDPATKTECSTCENSEIVLRGGYNVCVDCGEVLSKPFDALRGPCAQTGMATGFQRRRKSCKWSSTAQEREERQERRLRQDFCEIQNAMGLAQTLVDRSMELYKELLAGLRESRQTNCKRRDGLRAAAVFFACKEQGLPRQRKEIASKLKIPLKTVTRSCNVFLDAMGSAFREAPPLQAEDFVDRYCARLGIDDRAFVSKVVRCVEENGLLSHRAPTSITAACVAFAAEELGLGVKKRDVQAAFGNSVAILSKSHSVLKRHSGLILRKVAQISSPL